MVFGIGGRRKRRWQKGVFLPVGAIAAPILGTLGGVVIKNYLAVEGVDQKVCIEAECFYDKKWYCNAWHHQKDGLF